MNSESEKKSLPELKAQAQRNLDVAKQTTRFVSVPERSWTAMVQLQQTQINMLGSIAESLKTLATWSDLSDMQEEQLAQMTAHAKKTEQTLTAFQETLQAQAEQIQTATSTSMESFQSQASAGGADSDGDLDLDGELPITGWESERELLTATLIGGTDGEAELEEADFGFAYPDYSADHLGIDSAYLAADVMNILDNDSRVEDCTTMNQPQKNKKNTQSGGFKMSM